MEKSEIDNILKQNSHLKDENEQLKSENSLLYFATKAISFEMLFIKIVELLKNKYGFESALLFSVNNELNSCSVEKICVSEIHAKPEKKDSNINFSFEGKNSVIKKAFFSKNYFFKRMHNNETLSDIEEIYNLKSFLNVPVNSTNGKKLVLTLANHTKEIYFDEKNAKQIEKFIKNISSLIQKNIYCDNAMTGRDFLLNLLEHSPFGVLVINKNGEIIFSNPEIQSYGIFSIINNHNDYFLTQDEHVEHIIENAYKHALGGDTIKKENVNLFSGTKNQERLYNLIFTPVHSQTGGIDNVLLICIDNTEKAIAEKMISKDLKLARDIQESVIASELKNINDINIHVYFKPMIEVGGDIYDIYKLKDNYYRIFIADATGHGIQASLTTMLIKAEYDKIKIFDLSPEMILKIFNNVFCENYPSLNVFFTCAVLDIDVDKNQIIYSSAGNPRQYLIRDNILFNLSAGGTMIGVLKNIEYKPVSAEFKKGNKILLFTDGIFEEFSEDEIMYDQEKLFKAIENSRNQSVDNILNNIVNDVKRWMGNSPVNDDITLIGIEYTK